MAANRLSSKIDDLFEHEKWDEARRILEREREKDSEDHWILTQLGVTFYEQHQYKEALDLFEASRSILPECPLTLWNLAGTLDALGNHQWALPFYEWILASKKSPEDDPCWESDEWTMSLKADCVYRAGVCFQHLGKKTEAREFYHQYQCLLSKGIAGAYSGEDVTNRIRSLEAKTKDSAVADESRKAMAATLRALKIGSDKSRWGRLPDLKIDELVSGRRVASKR